nr:carboxypeptidase-like regulatory domain-containing protein [Ignavibacteria bacterium]
MPNRLLKFLLILAFIPIFVYSQSSGVINGKITRPDGAPIEGVIIILTSQGEKESGTETDSSGLYSISGLTPGKYSLKAEMPG